MKEKEGERNGRDSLCSFSRLDLIGFECFWRADLSDGCVLCLP